MNYLNIRDRETEGFWNLRDFEKWSITTIMVVMPLGNGNHFGFGTRKINSRLDSGFDILGSWVIGDGEMKMCPCGLLRCEAFCKF